MLSVDAQRLLIVRDRPRDVRRLRATDVTSRAVTRQTLRQERGRRVGASCRFGWGRGAPDHRTLARRMRWQGCSGPWPNARGAPAIWRRWCPGGRGEAAPRRTLRPQPAGREQERAGLARAGGRCSGSEASRKVPRRGRTPAHAGRPVHNKKQVLAKTRAAASHRCVVREVSRPRTSGGRCSGSEASRDLLGVAVEPHARRLERLSQLPGGEHADRALAWALGQLRGIAQHSTA